MHPPGKPNITSTRSSSSALISACAPVILFIAVSCWAKLEDDSWRKKGRTNRAEKRNDLPSGRSWRTRRVRPGALVDEYYEQASRGRHRETVCQRLVENTSRCRGRQLCRDNVTRRSKCHRWLLSGA